MATTVKVADVIHQLAYRLTMSVPKLPKYTLIRRRICPYESYSFEVTFAISAPV